MDKEFVLLFTVMDENKSWLLDENIKRFCTDPDKAMKQKTHAGFVKSNKMYSINGRVFGNLEGLDMCVGDKISWHLFGIGTDTDVHSGILPQLQTTFVPQINKPVISKPTLYLLPSQGVSCKQFIFWEVLKSMNSFGVNSGIYSL